MPEFFSRVWAEAQDLARCVLRMVYPPTCAACGSSRLNACTPLCSRCLSTLEPRFEDGLPPRLFLGHHEGPLRRVIAQMKHGHRRTSATFLGYLLGRLVRTSFGPVDGVLSVPPSSNAIHCRVFDPARSVTEGVAMGSGLRIADASCLTKTRSTRKQAFLSSRDRRANVAHAFQAAPMVEDKTFILVDDVLTTGATLEACRRAVEDAGGRILGAAFLSRRPCFVDPTMTAFHGQPTMASP